MLLFSKYRYTSQDSAIDIHEGGKINETALKALKQEAVALNLEPKQ